MKLSLRIWFIAQLFNAIGSLLVYQELGLFIMLFAFLGGLPAIPMYWGVMKLTQRMTSSRASALATILIAAPTCTAICGWATIMLLGMRHGETRQFLFIPVIVTAISVAIHAPSIFDLTPSTEE